MEHSETVDLRRAPDVVWPFIADLTAYPGWLRFVHRAGVADVADPDGRAAWNVELRARVGPFARSKQLRMVRVREVENRAARFERVELDGRDHANWILDAALEPLDGERSRLTMQLSYDGQLWTGGLLDRVLRDEIAKARESLDQAVLGAAAK